MTTDKRKRIALTHAINEKLYERQYDDNREIAIEAIERRKQLERNYRVVLFIERHAISAWTKRTPIVTWFL